MADFVRKHLKLLLETSREALIHDPYEEFSKEGWFLYFWKEARDQDGIYRNSGEVLAFFNDLYELPKQWDLTGPANQLEEPGPFYAYKGGVPEGERVKVLGYKDGKNWGNVDDQILFNLLNACLKVGFERIKVVPNGNELGEIQADSPLAFARHSLILGNDHHYTLGWRGDGRDLGQLKDAGGFINKAQSEVRAKGESESYAEKILARKPWNPFSKPENRCDYFYRKMQQDNCLHTAVSVTLDFVTASTFPKLEDMLGSLFGGYVIQPSATVEGLPDHLRNKLCRVVTGTGKKLFRYADRQQLYLVVLFGAFFDTQKRQASNPFPEVAVKRIPIRDILGSLSFVRVFDGLQESQGFTAHYDQAKSVWPTMERMIAFTGDWAIARSLWPTLHEEITKITTSMPFHARWTGSRGEIMGTPEKVWQVTKPNGTRLL